MSDNKSNSKDYKSTLIDYWKSKSFESLEAARSDYAAGRLTPARNRGRTIKYELTEILH